MTSDTSERVLVVAPVGRDAPLMAALLEENALQATVCADVREACEQVARGAGALILAEESLDGGELDLLSTVLGAQPPWSELPVIVLAAARASQSAHRLEVLYRAAGVITVLERPLSTLTLLRNVQVALRSRRRQYEVRNLLAAQRESELRYRTLVRATSSLTWSCPPTGLFVEPQPEWMAFTGQSATESLGTGWLDAVHPEDRLALECAWNEALRAVAPFTSEHRVRRRDGEWRWMNAQAAPVTNERGEVVTWTGMNVDIHERKETERQLRESEHRFATMADGVPAMIWVTDRGGRLEYGNRSFCEFFGRTVEQVRHDGWHTLVHPDDHEPYVNTYAHALANRTSFRARGRVRHHAGAWRWIESHGVPRFDDLGRFLGHVGLSPDVTDLVAAESALILADRRKDQFLATLSHELRNPIAPIRTAAQLLAAPSLSPERLQWVQRVIQRQVAHMAGLLDDLLNVARITQGKLELKRDDVTVASVVETATEAAKPLIDQKSHALVVCLDPGLPVIHVDPLRLAEVLTNLLTNAAKYTDPGGTIELHAHVAGGELVFDVSDTGIGIDRQALSSVFEMFSQVRGNAIRSEGGLGIGLALAKGLIEMHGGRIEARSEGPGRGSTFTVRLPNVSAVPHEPRAPARDRALDAVRRILVVDDNRDAADMLALLLRMNGHEVRVAYDAGSGIAVAGEFPPDVALLDIGLPDVSGYELARRLRSLSGDHRLCLVALTGWGQDDDRRRATEAGFDHHLVKPVDADRLQGLLARA